MPGERDRWGVIDDESIAEAVELIGVPLRRDRMQWNRAASRDAIRQFADGVPDSNPLWRDPTYGSSTRWGGLLAPPSFLYSVDSAIVAPKLPGVQWIYAGTRWRWYDVVNVDDDFDVAARLIDVSERSGRRFDRWVLQTGEIEYRRGGGDLLAVAEGRVARTPRARAEPTSTESSDRASAKDAGSSTRGVAASTTAEAHVEPSVGPRRARRGASLRPWESVDIGHVAGPGAFLLAVDDILSWYAGAMGALHYGGAHADAVRYRHRHDDYSINAETGAKDSAARGHLTAREGKEVGMGGVYDVGLQRIAWVIATLTDWMGDDGHLAEVDVSLLRPNLAGEVTTITGTVTRKWRDTECFVHLDIAGTNQDGRLTTKGHAVVALPSEEHGEITMPLFGADIGRWFTVPASQSTTKVN